MNAREETLNRIKKALSQPVKAKRDSAAHSYGQAAEAGWFNQTALVEKFRQELEKVGGFFVENDPGNYLLKLTAGMKTAVCWQAVGENELRIIESLKRNALEIQADDGTRRKKEFLAVCERANVGITCADFAIAESGTLCLIGGAGRARAISLLPPVHVALVKRENFVSDLSDVFRRLENGKAPDFPASAVTFITGPSRTADIELKLVVGVHGAQELHVILC